MKTLVICNGTPPSRELFQRNLEEADLLIAADGGAHIALRYGHAPDVVTGDLDSYRPEGEEPFEVVENHDQETNDLEKALALALDRGAAESVIMAATGERVDQTLKNLSVLKRFDSRFRRLLIRDDHGDTFLLPRRASLRLPEETLVSLFPLSGRVTGITTEGLRYGLEDEALENGVRDGSSNRAAAEEVTIRYESGDLIAFIASEYTLSRL